MSAAVSRTGRSIAGTFVLILLAIVGLSAIDDFLARKERLETDREAEQLFADGLHIEQAGNYPRAIDRFRAALSIRGEQEHYAVALADALLKAGRLPEAQSVLGNVLQRDSINGEANLLIARVLVKQGKIAEAESHYHHAIYDQWPENARKHRMQARFELIELLVRYHKSKELLSELLALQIQSGGDISALERLAPLYLVAGSPGHAAEAFTEILRSEPGNASAHEGLGEAKFTSGDYQPAQQEFQSALRLDPGDRQFQARLELCRRVLQLDPTRRGLSMQDRYRRSIEILKLALNSLRQCSSISGSPSVRELIGLAEGQLWRHIRASQEDEAIEANLSLAEKLWHARKAECKQVITPAEQPVDLVLARISN